MKPVFRRSAPRGRRVRARRSCVSDGVPADLRPGRRSTRGTDCRRSAPRGRRVRGRRSCVSDGVPADLRPAVSYHTCDRSLGGPRRTVVRRSTGGPSRRADGVSPPSAPPCSDRGSGRSGSVRTPPVARIPTDHDPRQQQRVLSCANGHCVTGVQLKVSKKRRGEEDPRGTRKRESARSVDPPTAVCAARDRVPSVPPSRPDLPTGRRPARRRPPWTDRRGTCGLCRTSGRVAPDPSAQVRPGAGSRLRCRLQVCSRRPSITLRGR